MVLFMKEFDIDEILEATKKTVINTSGLDIDGKFEEISIIRIISEIEKKSQNMTSEYKKNSFYKDIIPLSSAKDSPKVKFLKGIEAPFRKLPFYENRIRPILKRKGGNLVNGSVIDGKAFLKYNGAEFISVVYRSILSREPDEEAYKNGIKFLRTTSNDKIDFIMNMLYSEEAKGKNIKVTGITKRRMFLRLKRGIYKIPILGYGIRFCVNLILLPRRLTQFQTAIDMMHYEADLLNWRSDRIEYSIDTTKKETRLFTETTINFAMNEVKGYLAADLDKINGLNNQIIQLDSQLDSQIGKLDNKLFGLSNEVVDLEKFQQDILSKKKEDIERKTMEKLLMDKFYLRYNEVLMPDSRESVKSRAKVYISKIETWFSNKNKKEIIAVDLGCGECEWIELLQENGIKGTGVDSNTQVIQKVRQTLPNIDIVESDAFGYLKNLAEGSIDLLSSFHMVEHLDMLEIIELLAECTRVLKKDGMLIMETPNPQNILTSSYYFNMDPTHKKPIPPELLTFFIEESGLKFKEKVLLYPLEFVPYVYKKEDPIADIVYRFNMEQAYSILAVKK